MCSSVDDLNSTTDKQLREWKIPDVLIKNMRNVLKRMGDDVPTTGGDKSSNKF